MSLMGLLEPPLPPVSDQMTPVEALADGIWAKRDDLFSRRGVNGSKLQQALRVLGGLRPEAPRGIVGWGGRFSTTGLAMGAAALEHDAVAEFHCPSGAMTDEMRRADALGVKIVQHRPGYLTTCYARARASASSQGFALGLLRPEAFDAVAAQVANLRDLDPAPTRVVVACGGYVLLTGIVLGLRAYEVPLPVLAVQVGAAPPRPGTFMGDVIRDPRVTHVQSAEPYAQPRLAELDGITLDPLYEAKLVPFLEPGDLIWISGCR